MAIPETIVSFNNAFVSVFDFELYHLLAVFVFASIASKLFRIEGLEIKRRGLASVLICIITSLLTVIVTYLTSKYVGVKASIIPSDMFISLAATSSLTFPFFKPLYRFASDFAEGRIKGKTGKEIDLPDEML